MERSRQEVSPAQVRYARLRALVDLQVAELVAALDRHETSHNNWERPEKLSVIERRLKDIVDSLELGETRAVEAPERDSYPV